MEHSHDAMFLIKISILILLFLNINHCHGGSGHNGSITDTNNTALPSHRQPINDKLTSRRRSKQFLIPLVWPYSVQVVPASDRSNGGGDHSHFVTFLPLQYYHLYYPSVTPANQSPTNRKFIDSFAGNYISSHASINKLNRDDEVACKIHGTVLGSCKSFTECFPMMEVEYGIDGSFMDSPLVEQLILTTNATVCSQNQNGKHEAKVCCSQSSPFRSASSENGVLPGGNDNLVHLPTVTQRPPFRNAVSARLIKEKMCGRPRPYTRGQTTYQHKAQAQLKITGGVEAKGPFEFPWMAGIFGKNRKLFCGGTLITDKFVMTAAHCFATFTAADIPHLYVQLGDFNIASTADGPHEVRKIEKVILNKGFKIETYHNDIALLRLDRPVNFSDRIQPICLPESTMKSRENQQVVVTGWGRKFRYGSISDILRKVEMPVWNHEDCKRVYATFAPGRLLDSHICAGDGKKNKDACIGDSGGPAIHWDGEKWVQVGITSWGKGCGNFPGVYTRVDKFLMWITKNLNLYS